MIHISKGNKMKGKRAANEMSYEEGQYQAWSDAFAGGAPGVSEVVRMVQEIKRGRAGQRHGPEWRQGYLDLADDIISGKVKRGDSWRAKATKHARSSDETLRKGLIRLAHSKPELRASLLPLLERTGNADPRLTKTIRTYMERQGYTEGDGPDDDWYFRDYSGRGAQGVPSQVAFYCTRWVLQDIKNQVTKWGMAVDSMGKGYIVHLR